MLIDKAPLSTVWVAPVPLPPPPPLLQLLETQVETKTKTIQSAARGK